MRCLPGCANNSRRLKWWNLVPRSPGRTTARASIMLWGSKPRISLNGQCARCPSRVARARPARADVACSTLFLPLQFVSQVDHLADVVLHVGGALHDHIKAGCGIRACARVWAWPVAGRLRPDRLLHHGDGVVEALERFVLRRRIEVVKLARAIANVAGLGDLRADV